MKVVSTKQTAHRLAAVFAIVTAIATGTACAAEPYYWTGATSADYNTAENWSSNHVAVATYAPYWRWASTPMYFETADIISYRIEFGKSSYARGTWTINAGTETQPLEFYCAKGSTLVSPDCSQHNYASGLIVASTCDSWVWINGGQWDEFTRNVNIGSSDYAGHLIIGNDRGVDTLFKIIGGYNFIFNQGSIAVSNATVNIGGQLIVGNTAGKLTSFDSYNSTMVISNYFTVKNSAIFDLCGGSITNAAQYLTVDDFGEMTIRDGGRYACQSQLIVGNYGTGTLNIIDGGEAASGSMLTLGYRSGSSGTVNIANCGILTVPYIYLRDANASATVALDGGTIRAAKDNERLIRSANNLYVTVGANGGTIDAAGYNVTIEEDLDNASGATGKMTFKGGGTVTLSGAINYTGGTTVEAGTVVVVPDVAKRTALGTITVTGLENNICEVVRLSGEGTFSAGDLPANTETVTFSVSLDGKSILAVNGLESPFWIGGSGDLSTAANWSDGVVPTENPTIKWSSPITLTNSGGFAPNTLTIPDDSAVVTLAGALTVNCLTNASRLAVASTGSLTVTGDLVGTTDVGYGWGILLYSNEGTVTANRVVGYATVDHTRFNEYESVTANTTPICAKGIVYKNMPSPAQLMHMYLAEARDGLWVVGEDGFSFENTRQSDYTTFAVGNTDNSVVATLFSSADWMLRNSGRPNSWNGDIWVAKNGALVIDTSDYADSSIGHTITLNGRIRTTSDASASAVIIKGCGTVVVNTTGSYSGLTVEQQNTYIASGKTLSVTNSATLQVNVDKKILGEGTISLAAGTTLALPSNADRTFTTPDIIPVTLPDEGTATIKIDGGKLRNDVDYVLLNSVPTGYAEHLVVTGSALDGRHYRLSDDGEGHLVLNIASPGTILYLR